MRARLFYAFWYTGNAEYASAAVDNNFHDNVAVRVAVKSK
jgi:hypothetical protein